MHKLLDLNAWLALFLEGHGQHPIARQWYEEANLAPAYLNFCRSTEIGFLRLLTQPQVMQACRLDAFTNDEAIGFLSQIQRDEAIGFVGEAPGTRALWLAMSRSGQASPKTWMDAYLAAMAITQDMELVTFDKGFRNYQDSGLKLQLLVDA
jgi:uncharacterized protein